MITELSKETRLNFCDTSPQSDDNDVARDDVSGPSLDLTSQTHTHWHDQSIDKKN